MLVKISKIIFILFVAIVICTPFLVNAEEEAVYQPPIKKAYILYDRLSWQTYHFYISTDTQSDDNLDFEWTIDNKDVFTGSEVRSFFERGRHTIALKVQDQYGNVRRDNVTLNITFWSLQNNWFWWVLYLFVILIILYYWVGKMIYLFNKRKMTKHVKHFFSFFDDHGWVEKIVEEHVKKARKQ